MAKIILLTLLVCLVACGGGRDGGPAPVPAPGPDIISMGRICIWVGGISIVVGIFAKLAMAVAGTNPLVRIATSVPGVSGLVGLLAEFGAVTLISGIIFMWLGANLWTLWISILILAIGYAVYRRRTLYRWLLSWKKG